MHAVSVRYFQNNQGKSGWLIELGQHQIGVQKSHCSDACTNPYGETESKLPTEYMPTPLILLLSGAYTTVS